MHRSTLLLATVVTALAASGRAALAGGCDPGTIAAPASFDGAIRPALAEDVDPAEGVVEVYLTAREAEWGFGIGSDTQVWTYNGVLPGPTIEAGVGDTLIVHLCNDLPEDTTIHWHGVETPADMDGSHIAQLTVPPGGSFRYEFPLLRAGTFWYHPHVRTHVAVEHGLYGLLIVRDPAEDRALDLPEREHLVVLDDVLLDPDGEIHEPFTGSREDVALEMLNGREGPLLLLNGVNQPTLTMEKGVPHRVRVLNAANARFQRVSVPDHPFWRIGGDQGLLEAPIRLEPAATSLLAPPPPTRLQPCRSPATPPTQGARPCALEPTHVTCRRPEQRMVVRRRCASLRGAPLPPPRWRWTVSPPTRRGSHHLHTRRNFTFGSYSASLHSRRAERPGSIRRSPCVPK